MAACSEVITDTLQLNSFFREVSAEYRVLDVKCQRIMSNHSIIHEPNQGRGLFMSDTAKNPGGIGINASTNSADQLLHVFFMPFFLFSSCQAMPPPLLDS